MSTYDGTQKANSGCAQNIPYHIFRTSYVDNLRQDALAMASSEAIAFCDVDNFSGPEIECDASTLTEDEWQKRRAHTIGGSDCAAIFGENRYKTNLDVYYEKIGQQPVFAQEETPESRLNKLWGHIAEEYIKQWIAERYPYCEIFYDTNIYRYPEKPYITANIDGMMRKPDGSYCLLEFKTANSMKKGEWENGNVPPQYIYQVRQYMAILGVWECIVVCMFDRDNVVANNKLFALERKFSEMSDGARKTARQVKVEPLLDAYWWWLEKLEPVPGSKLAEAVTYAKNQKPYLNAFLDHGEVDISNNFAENAIRPFVVGRKGWLFCDSPKGADSSAIVYTLVETAKANGLDPYRYLERTLTELPYLGKNPKQEYLDAFMPWSSAMHRVCTLPAADHSAGVL